ncbi:MAG: hypothetical protein JNK63_04050 [Chthonomonas sp.]|nr:hypothetical protein [Chthonomonas sp.]
MIVDLRSDTVTQPTPEMWEAMRSAALGDDVLGDDPTVMELEAFSADLLGKEAAVFVPSGTMGNQLALASATERGDCALFEEEAHMLYYEVGAPGVIAQVTTRTCPADNGVMDPGEVESRIQVTSLHTPGTTFIGVENTNNRAGGSVVPISVTQEYRRIADEYGIWLHLDGARMFNACTDIGCEPKEMADPFDSVNFCLSKALGAPVGSVLCGPAEFIIKARKWRKRLGGGMRQAGLLAAAGLVGLRSVRHRLSEDHDRARAFAGALDGKPGLSARAQTNFVMVDTEQPAAAWVSHLEQNGVRCMAFRKNRVRCVFHYDISDEMVEHAVKAFTESQP